MDKRKLLALAEAVEKLTGPDRETDLAIHLAFNPDGDAAIRIKFGIRGLTGESGQRWELSRGALLYEQRDDRGKCWANGGIPIATYTASLDAAMSLATGFLLLHLSDIGADGLPLCRIGDGTLAAPYGEWVGIASDLPRSVVAACLRARAQAEALV